MTKAMSRGISGAKKVLKFSDASNRGPVCLFSQNDSTILGLKNVQFEFRQVSRYYGLLSGYLRSLRLSKK